MIDQKKNYLLPSVGKRSLQQVASDFQVILEKGKTQIQERAKTDIVALEKKYENEVLESQLVQLIIKRDIGEIKKLDEYEILKAQGSVTLSTWVRLAGEENIIVAMCELISITQEELNIKSKMSDEQITNVSIGILGSHPAITIKSLRFVLTNGITGKYGQLYNRLDIEIISEWLTAFENELAIAREAEYQSEKVGDYSKRESEKQKEESEVEQKKNKYARILYEKSKTKGE